MKNISGLVTSVIITIILTIGMLATVSASDNVTYYYDEFGNKLTGWQNIDGFKCYLNEYGVKSSLSGIDVSSHQGNINWGEVRSSGVDFAIIRIGYGDDILNQDDRYAVYNMSECERLGIPYGVYLYSYALNFDNVNSEVQHTLRMINGRNPVMGVYYDMEDADGYKAKYGMPTNDMLSQFCVSYMTQISNMGYQTGLYASKYWLTNILTSPQLNGFDKWVAQWNDTCTYSEDFVMWQYASDGSIPGIIGNVDLNVRLTSETGMVINKSSLDLISIGSSDLLFATSNLADSTLGGVIWTSDNESVATVDATGKVTANGYGTAIITASLEGYLPVTCEVTVSKDYSGIYYIRSKNSNQVMDVYGGGDAIGTNIIQWPYHGGINQQWLLESLGNGYYKITSELNPVYSLDVYGGGTIAGTRVIQWTYLGGTNQQWKIIENTDGYISFMSRLSKENGSDYLLDVYGGGRDAGVSVIQWSNTNGDNQKWQLEPVQDYVASYDSNGGSPVTAAGVMTGRQLTEPQEPTKEGLLFAGWYTDDTYTTLWDFNSDRMPAEDMVLYARWINDYSGTYIIRSKSSNLVLEADGGKTEIGTGIIQSAHRESANQFWKVESLGKGYYKIVPAVDETYSLDIYGGTSDPGSRVIQWTYHDGTNQQWEIIENEDGTVSFMSKLAKESASGCFLDVYGGSGNEGTAIIQWPANGGDNQKWYMENVNY
ncbi:RICIN domain-containing protein [Parasporobacterium paucivorans]|uniref:Listeria/Bacterioides repeat-containing protein n=1 Tax=Parasporobacterium paucivorans DSM 15970 TaxID=1122934 RepID=A0A1M6JV26_9FIRM|nr:RICIN domain-containing protein [Parasporobacterium paucivorans]SHJ50519.1 Listeria/Bacterioides repeat-containing protein [Parasporobacterium paucivorans DSM 15970]